MRSKTILVNNDYSITKLLIKEVPTIHSNLEDKFEFFLLLPEWEKRKGEGGLRTQGVFKKSYEYKPLISVATVVFNGEKYLEETILSVINQTYDNVEYIIIDGGSTDGTLDIIKKYENQIDYWVSEPDNGIYDAMNKGIGASKGDIIGIVNADDVLYGNTLEEVSKMIMQYHLDYVYGSVHMMNEHGTIKGEMSCMDETEIEEKKYHDIPFPHPTLFVQRKVYEKIGLFNTKFKLSADYDFILRLLEEDFTGMALPTATGKFRNGGSSGGVATFIDTKNVLISHKAPKLSVYRNMYTSMVKVFLMKYFPQFSSKIRKLFRKNSRHKSYEETDDT